MKKAPKPSQLNESPNTARSRNRLLGALLLSAATIEGGCAPAPSSHPRQAACADFQLEVEEFWSAGIRAEVLGYSGKGEIAHHKAVVNKMDRTSEDWVRLRQSACMDHERGLLSPTEYKERVACFDKWLQQQRTLVETIRGGGGLSEAENSLSNVLSNAEQCN